VGAVDQCACGAAALASVLDGFLPRCNVATGELHEERASERAVEFLRTKHKTPKATGFAVSRSRQVGAKTKGKIEFEFEQESKPASQQANQRV
jgi:hypothetical protein